MLAPNQPRESMWLLKKNYPPSNPRENPISGQGLSKDALTSRCAFKERTRAWSSFLKVVDIWPQQATDPRRYNMRPTSQARKEELPDSRATAHCITHGLGHPARGEVAVGRSFDQGVT